MAATDRSTALQPAPTESHSQLAVKEAHGNRQETNSASTSTAETDTRWENEFRQESRSDYSFAEYPTTDTFHDESIAHWPAITCSELGSERIRLVRIAPGPSGGVIECEVSTFFLKMAPSYAAVSYTWGSPLGFREILIEGRPHSVPKNLWRFLNQARNLPGLTRLTGWLWIDALSINQSDPQEKLDQVGIISDISKKAEHVIVWLRPSNADSDHALAALHVVRARRHRRNSRTVPGPVWSALHNLCERPYWRRLWVYQELKSALCAQLMCGNKLFSLRDFQDYMFDTAAHRLEEKLDILRKSSAGMMLRLIEDPAKTSLWSLIKETSHLRCIDPRDKAYAVLNIAQIGREEMAADYTILTPVLLNQILKNMHYICKPETLHEVAEQCMELERLFREPPNSIFQTEGSVAFSRSINPLKELASYNLLPDFRLQHLLAAWCDFYSHRHINQLVLPLSRTRSDRPHPTTIR
ncbi:hypothetical protein Q7P36_004481 [Cladosporium allicinum]